MHGLIERLAVWENLTDEGLFKEAYAEGIVPLAPEIAKIYKKVGMLADAEKVGNNWHVPVILQHELDHLDGILFIDRMRDPARDLVLRASLQAP
mgnify:CR=1 FL=1